MRHLTPFIAAAAIVLGAAPALFAAVGIDVDGIEKYVFPANKPAAPKKMTFSPDGLTYLQLSDDGQTIRRYEAATGKEVETVVDLSRTREGRMGSIADFVVSPNGGQILLYEKKQQIYRRSFRAEWMVYEVRSRLLRPLSTEHAMQQSPIFSPDSRMVAFVADNNIFIKKLDYNSEVQVTTNGEPNHIINGVPDWTYEEEFSTTCSMAWSPDNSTLCYLRYDETAVPTYRLTLYEGYCHPNPDYALYPGEFAYKYPVAGKPNSVVSLHSYDVDTRKPKDISLTDPNIEYIPRIEFAGEGAERLMVVTLNRDQTRMDVYAANPKSTVVRSVLTEQWSAWIDPATYEEITFEPNRFMLLSSRTGFSHLYSYAYNGTLIEQITSGDYDVTAYYGTDADGCVYYQSTATGPLNRVVSRRDAKGKKTDLTPTSGTASLQLLSGQFYTLTVSDAATPPVTRLYSAKGKSLRALEDNADYGARYAGLPQKEFITVNSDGYALNGYMIRPANFTPSKRYPVIMWQYSGPGSQEVANKWQMDWEYYAAEQGFIVVCVDGRGTGYRGRAFQDVVYKQLGHYETIDQLNVARHLATLPYVDPDRIGISGWSYGGYETLMAVTAEGSPFAAAVAIAPVSSWRYYDTVYAERYMLTPSQNPDGYETSAPISRADRLRCPLLIMHGTADDNVHPANTLEFVSRLQQAGLYCDMFLFPNMNHSIYGCGARALVYGRMIGYFAEKLRP